MPKKKSPNTLRLRNSTAEFLTFAYQTGGDGVEVRVQDGMIWLSQKHIGQLFETTPENVLMHLKNIFAGEELVEDSVAKIFLATAADGKNYRIKHYNLDAIIAVCYRMNSKRATASRQWATDVLRDYTLRGYVMDRKRMENGAFLSEDIQPHRRDFKLITRCTSVPSAVEKNVPAQASPFIRGHSFSFRPLFASQETRFQPVSGAFLPRLGRARNGPDTHRRSALISSSSLLITSCIWLAL